MPVEKLQRLVADGLQSPQRHVTDQPGDLAHRLTPLAACPLRVGERAATSRQRSHGAEYYRRLARSGAQDEVLVRGRRFRTTAGVRLGLPPVVGDELLGQPDRLNPQGGSGVLPTLDAHVGESQEQRVLIGGRKQPFVEQALDVLEEGELRLRGRKVRRVHDLIYGWISS